MADQTHALLVRGILIVVAALSVGSMAGTVIAQPSLTAWWPFEGDFSSAVNNDVYVGTTVGMGTSIGSATGEFMIGTGGLRIDDSLDMSNYLEIGTTPLVESPTATTVSAWYRLDDIAGNGMDTRNFVWETAPSDWPLSFGARSDTSDGHSHAQWYTESPSFSSSANAGPIVDDGQWHHAAVVIDQEDGATGRVRYYHDGAIWDDVALPAGFSMTTSPTGFKIGNHRTGDGSRNWDGFIDDVAVFNGALSEMQVSSLYHGSHTPLSAVGGLITDPPEPAPDPLPFVPGSWTMVVLPDTQNYSTLNNGIFSNITEWALDNRDNYDIGLVLCEGDVTNNNSVQEWQVAKNAMSVLDGQVPYIMATGNHDYSMGGDAGNRSTLFNNYFDESLYVDGQGEPVFEGLTIAAQFEDVSRFGSSSDNETLENIAYQFSAPDGRELLIFSLEWGVRQEVIDWANKVAERPEFAQHTAMLVTHAYLYSDNTRYDWTNQNSDNDEPGNTHSGSAQGANPHAYSTAHTDDANLANDTNDGEELWRELVGKQDNFELAFNGHVIVGGQLGYLLSAGSAGQNVHQMLFNAQVDPNGGDGWVRLIEFLPDQLTVQVKTYSPYRDSLGLDPWRTDAANQFVLSISEVSVYGDLNGDLNVDADDWLLFLTGHGSQFPEMTPDQAYALGDLDGDFDNDLDDFVLFHATYNHINGAGSFAALKVPEPFTLTLALYLGCFFGLYRNCLKPKKSP
jgi:concanavalin A-like lectin/glucanase superfamily protein/calcineurin-like phosphoesterase family protein